MSTRITIIACTVFIVAGSSCRKSNLDTPSAKPESSVGDANGSSEPFSQTKEGTSRDFENRVAPQDAKPTPLPGNIGNRWKAPIVEFLNSTQQGCKVHRWSRPEPLEAVWLWDPLPRDWLEVSVHKLAYMTSLSDVEVKASRAVRVLYRTDNGIFHDRLFIVHANKVVKDLFALNWHFGEGKPDKDPLSLLPSVTLEISTSVEASREKMEVLLEKLRGMIDGDNRNSNVGYKGTRDKVIVTVLPVYDVDAFAAKIDFVEVTEIDGRAFKVNLKD
jgi:hypothetical protein